MDARRSLGLIVFAGLFAAGPTVAQDVGGLTFQDPNKCATVTPTAPMEAFGYSHVVELKNTCSRPVSCEVWTDVDPTPKYKLDAKPGETVSVTTRKGSPAREFKAEKSCRYVASDQKRPR